MMISRRCWRCSGPGPVRISRAIASAPCCAASIAAWACTGSTACRATSTEIEGGPVTITANQGLSLGLILYELGTNAAKYGALSRPDGRVNISWRVEAASDRQNRLTWRERGGPEVEARGELGFGSKLIERACTYDLDGAMELDHARDGFFCEMVFPLKQTAWPTERERRV
jgi:two-component sensor histidine kinase